MVSAGMRKALIISPPTLDVIGGRCRAGGPSLYAGYTFHLMGFEPFSVGPIGYVTCQTVRVEEDIGVRRLGYAVASEGMVFRISYSGARRRVTPVYQSPVIDVGEVLGVLRELGWTDIILVSPVYGEELGALPRLANNYSGMIIVDVQGYVRRSLPYPGERGVVQVIHASRDEADSASEWGLFLLTDGPGKIEVYLNGERLYSSDPPGRILEDPTGAGDVFTAAFSSLLARGYTVEDAVIEASELVPHVLSDIHGRIWIEECFV